MSEGAEIIQFPRAAADGRWALWQPHIEAFLRSCRVVEPVVAEIVSRVHAAYERAGMSAPPKLPPFTMPDGECGEGITALLTAMEEHHEAIEQSFLSQILRLEVFIYSALPNVPRPAAE